MDEKKKTKRFSQKNKKGFSLLEVLVAVSIFSLASVMMAGSFSSFLKNSISAKKVQRSAESAQYTMNLMAKTIRTSTLNPNSLATPGQITVFDNSQGFCIRYVYEDGLLKMASVGGGGITGIDDCDSATFSTLAPLTKAGEVLGMTVTSPSSAVGRVTILMSLQSGNTLQSSVSLRGSSVAAPPLLTCADGIQNQGETQVDCGGPNCAACFIPPTCADGIQNQGETQVDCGGPNCAACAPPICTSWAYSAWTPFTCPMSQTQTRSITSSLPAGCVGGASITSQACVYTPTCSDGVQNGTEAGVDCGGSCAACGNTVTFSWSGAPANSIRIAGVVYGGTGSVAKSGTSMTAKVFGANGQVGGGEPDGSWDYLRARKSGGAGSSRSATFSLVNGETYVLNVGTTPAYAETFGGAGGYTYAEASPSKYVAAAGGGGGGEEAFWEPDEEYWADGYYGGNAASWRAAIGGGGGNVGTEWDAATAGGAGSHAYVGEMSSTAAAWGGYMIDITVTP